MLLDRLENKGEIMTEKRTVVLMPGDGIGKTVLPEAVKVLDAAGFEAASIVCECLPGLYRDYTYEKHNIACPARPDT